MGPLCRITTKAATKIETPSEQSSVLMMKGGLESLGRLSSLVQKWTMATILSNAWPTMTTTATTTFKKTFESDKEELLNNNKQENLSFLLLWQAS